MGSVKRFGYEWGEYTELDANYERQFGKWVFPLTKEDFAGKSVLDAGCGMGRNSCWALRWGAARVTAFDFDERSVASARQTLAQFPNASVCFKSIYDIDWQDEFDISFSLGVIHHLERPREALGKMVRATKKGGTVLVWLYGYKSNEWIVRYVSPVRKLITSKLPPWLLDYLTYLVSLPFVLYVRLVPTRNVYRQQLKSFSFRHIHSIIFDQLLPEIAHYYKKDEARELLEGIGLENVRVYPCNENSWVVLGTKI